MQNQQTQFELNRLSDVEAARNAEKQILTNASDPNWWATQEGFELGKDGKLTREPTEKERNEAIMKMLNSNPNITLKRRLEMDAALGKHGITKLQNKALEVVAEGKLFAQKNLDELINASADETKRLENYSYEYFITYTPDSNGQTSTPTTKTVSGTSGGDISESSSYKSGTTGTATYFTIYSCGCDAAANSCNAQNNVIVPLEAVVTLVN